MPKFALKLCGISFNFAVHARTDIHPCEQREVVKVSHRSVLGAFAFWFCLWEVSPVFWPAVHGQSVSLQWLILPQSAS